MRRATAADIPAMLAMLADLHRQSGQPLAFDASTAGRALAGMIASDDALCLFTGTGLLIASVARTAISPRPVAYEHAWIGGGNGRALAAAYEAWARGKGCAAIRLNPRLGDERAAGILTRMGYAPTEITWQKAI